MRRIVLIVSLGALALAFAAQAAQAKGGAEEQNPQFLLGSAPRLGAPPAGLAPGRAWDATITVEALKIDDRFFADVRIVRLEDGLTKTFTSHRAGSDFIATVIFPRAGHWAVQVLTPNQLWALYSSVRVGAVAPLGTRASGFPVLPVAASVLAVPALIGAMASIRRRRPGPTGSA
jgi:hypothetical protein